MLNLWQADRFLSPFLCLLTCFASSTAQAQVTPDENENIPHAKILWCSVQHPASKRVFMSEPAASTIQGHLPLWDAGNRFLNVVNARYTLTMHGGNSACGLYPDRRHAFKARDLTRTLAEKQGWQVMNIGSY